jgi:ribosome-binding protein aMBF1 (putative translation factor)
MSKDVKNRIRAAHQQQAREIRKLPAYDAVKREFDIEYKVACEVAKARAKANMTQHELAEAMGTTQSVISRIERGANVSIETLERYVSACGHHLTIRVV